MPRKARIDAPGALHHIIVRGIERRMIFTNDQDRNDFLARIGPILEETRTACFAWALIPNHFHLLLQTGSHPVATVMRRLLTGYAIGFNRRHNRHGHLFQNRYKSILCQQETYFLQLVRYIHLNPLRAGQVKDLKDLSTYNFCGHGVIMGNLRQTWQNAGEVLACFDSRVAAARRQYEAFVAKGVEQGRRSDLTGGGLIRSAGGWTAVRQMRKAEMHGKSDERILGDGDFVTQILARADEAFEKKYALKAAGVDLDQIAHRVAMLMQMPVGALWRPGRYRRLVMARSLFCFWAVRELGVSMTELADRFNISTAAVSKSVARGSAIAEKEGFDLV